MLTWIGVLCVGGAFALGVRAESIAPIAHRTGYAEMLDHRALTKDRSVQQSVFADGTCVTVNFGDTPFKMSDGSLLAPTAATTCVK